MRVSCIRSRIFSRIVVLAVASVTVDSSVSEEAALTEAEDASTFFVSVKEEEEDEEVEFSSLGVDGGWLDDDEEDFAEFAVEGVVMDETKVVVDVVVDEFHRMRYDSMLLLLLLLLYLPCRFVIEYDNDCCCRP